MPVLKFGPDAIDHVVASLGLNFALFGLIQGLATSLGGGGWAFAQTVGAKTAAIVASTALFTAIAGVLVEHFPGNTFDWADIASDMVGVVVGTVLLAFLALITPVASVQVAAILMALGDFGVGLALWMRHRRVELHEHGHVLLRVDFSKVLSCGQGLGE